MHLIYTRLLVIHCPSLTNLSKCHTHTSGSANVFCQVRSYSFVDEWQIGWSVWSRATDPWPGLLWGGFWQKSDAWDTKRVSVTVCVEWVVLLFCIIHQYYLAYLVCKQQKNENWNLERSVWRQQKWQLWGEESSWWCIGSCLSAVCLSVDVGHGPMLSADICHHLILPPWACCWKDTISPSFSNMSCRKRQNLWRQVTAVNCHCVRTTEV